MNCKKDVLVLADTYKSLYKDYSELVEKYNDLIKDYNRLGYQFMFNSINSDALIAHNLSSFFNLKLYSPYISDIACQKILPLP